MLGALLHKASKFAPARACFCKLIGTHTHTHTHTETMTYTQNYECVRTHEYARNF